MKLNRIKIIGEFKNIKNLALDFSKNDKISLLIGNNGSGKSNIIEAISSIFAGLYDNRYNPSFSYFLWYEIDGHIIKIKYKNNIYNATADGKSISLSGSSPYLPTQIVCSYSGEESRLWNNYFEPFYQEYTSALVSGTFPTSRMVYVNKYYWNVALITFFLYDFEEFTELGALCKEILGIDKINFLEFTFDNITIGKWKTNPVTQLIKILNPKGKPSIKLTIEQLKAKISYLGLGAGGERTFFRYLAAAFLPKGDKLVSNIEININDDLSAGALSEGEKKMILVQAVLEIASDENSLILLDEPDSHIHISRKAIFQRLLASYINRENIITTHSPTLTHAFDTKHIMMLGKNDSHDTIIEPQDRQDVIRKLTDGLWSSQEQTIFLNSENDILLVEGKFDEIFLSKALNVLQKTEARFKDLKFEYLPCGGASGVNLLIDKFKPKPNQKIIAIFDRDDAGINAINGIFERVGKKYTIDEYGDLGGFKIVDDYWISMYPKRKYYRGPAKFTVEDYFKKSLLNRQVLETFKSFDTIMDKDAVKRKLAKDCLSFDDKEFSLFSEVFDMILEIKSKP